MKHYGFPYAYPTNSISISPLLQSAINDFSPFSLLKGKLQSPFLIVQEIAKASQPPIIVPVILPSFAFKSIVFPTFTRSQIILSPFVSRLIFSVTDNELTFIFSFVVFTESAVYEMLCPHRRF